MKKLNGGEIADFSFYSEYLIEKILWSWRLYHKRPFSEIGFSKIFVYHVNALELIISRLISNYN